ncbi:MAG: MaoC family dehydratase N-terminal domain-containing protein, partial [Syntrophales bacterium]|nr:MaoC family dehydratase N-terminal domain-containing protein [Syntrophales bacterium]
MGGIGRDEHPRLKVGKAEKLPEHEEYTPEKQERRRARANKPYLPNRLYFNGEATADAIRHFAEGIGDTNLLFCDEEYAATTKYKGVIAPPCFLYSVFWVPLGSGAAGIHGWYSGGEWECYRPVYAGDKFSVVCILRDLVEKKGRMAGGKSIFIDYTDVVYVNQRNEVVAKERQHTVWAPRSSSGSAGKYRKTAQPVYGRDDWKRILEGYEKEEVRGKEPRFWEDVKVGNTVGPMIKGPLTVRDIIAWLMGAGSPFFRAHKIEYDFESRHPKALEYVEETGEADVPELVHIFDAFARAIG